MTFQRLNPSYGPGNLELALNDPKRHYFAICSMNSAFLLEQIFVMMRRSMLMVIQDPTAIVLAIVCSALEEAILRSTMVSRDLFFRQLLGKSEISDVELLYLRRTWAASIVMTMYTEFTAIITSRVMYIVFRQHRFILNLGYGFDSNDSGMTAATVLVFSAFIELVFEGVVDAYALGIEWRNGVDVKVFWRMWEANASAFWFLALSDSFFAIIMTLQVNMSFLSDKAVTTQLTQKSRLTRPCIYVSRPHTRCRSFGKCRISSFVRHPRIRALARGAALSCTKSFAI